MSLITAKDADDFSPCPAAARFLIIGGGRSGHRPYRDLEVDDQRALSRQSGTTADDDAQQC